MTYPTKCAFMNELDNEITIQIRNVMSTNDVLDHCIEIDIEGPDSFTELTITPMEARVLRDLLNTHVKE